MSCFICDFPYTLESHHIVPQFAGGEKGPTVDLCANCHSGVHRSALQAIAKKPKVQKYFTDEQMIKASPLIQFVVIFLHKIKENPNMDQKMNLYLKPDRRLMTVLHILKSDAGFTNLGDFCVWVLTRYATAKL